jgi:hypothetical protein
MISMARDQRLGRVIDKVGKETEEKNNDEQHGNQGDGVDRACAGSEKRNKESTLL